MHISASNSIWPEHPFEIGVAYIAQETFNAFPYGKFIAGNEYVFVQEAYSYYDASAVFTFSELGKAELLNWFLHDEEPIDLCKQRFKLKCL